MPTLPATDGLPIWAQVLVSILVCVATLAVAFKGYFGKGEGRSKGEESATLAGASVLDNLSMRQLSDALAHLSNDVVNLERTMGENTHWVRCKHEQDREICQRLRELREELERRSKD